ncbi:MAG: DNA repair protein RecO [Gemmatimonadetes bacterium]|nr:DNA repair protein RecO [Gemmatimonadota bacterium]
MAPISTPAIVLHTFPYGESSKIVRLATREHGVLSAIAKGARRPKSRFGARIQLLSEGIAQLYIKQTRDLQTLAEFDVENQRVDLSHDVVRYASATAIAELVLRFSPEEPHPEIYQLLSALLDTLAEIETSRLAEVSLGAMWSIVGALGFAPAIDGCAVDGRAIGAGDADFSVADGGLVCATCARARETSRIGADDRAALRFLVQGGVASMIDDGTWSLSPKHAAAHRRLLSRFVRLHVAEGRELRALDFWEGLPWVATS